MLQLLQPVQLSTRSYCSEATSHLVAKPDSNNKFKDCGCLGLWASRKPRNLRASTIRGLKDKPVFPCLSLTGRSSKKGLTSISNSIGLLGGLKSILVLLTP